MTKLVQNRCYALKFYNVLLKRVDKHEVDSLGDRKFENALQLNINILL